MAADLTGLVEDLRAESDVVIDILAGLDDADWRLPTPATGWSVTDQVSHLAYFDGTTLLSLTDPERFRAEAAELTAVGDAFPDHIAERHRHLAGPALLTWFRRARSELLTGYARVDPRARLPWYGPDMGAASSVTARLMETWAHGQDIADAVGVWRQPTDRLRHIAHLAVHTYGFSFALHGLPVPSEAVRVELLAPSGAVWTWGPVDAENRVTGPALDFCLAVTQRRHPSDVALHRTGETAQAWLAIAQTFAGAPGTGRAPLTPEGTWT